MTNNFLCLLSIERKFRDVLVIRCPVRRKDLEHTIWQLFGGVVVTFGGIPPPQKKMPDLNAD